MNYKNLAIPFLNLNVLILVHNNLRIALFFWKGTFLVTQTICKELVEKNLSGSIINIGSVVSQRGNKGQCNYSASKAAVEVFSKTVALEMAKFGEISH